MRPISFDAVIFYMLKFDLMPSLLHDEWNLVTPPYLHSA